jgi:hypothetical protein
MVPGLPRTRFGICPDGGSTSSMARAIGGTVKGCDRATSVPAVPCTTNDLVPEESAPASYERVTS